MLTFHPLGSHSVDYYESTVNRSQGDAMAEYYDEQGDALPEAWMTGNREQISDRLGVAAGQTLDREEVSNWIGSGISPAGEQLGRKFSGPEAKRPTRPGFDGVICAPKSVSLLWALSDDPEVHAAIDRAHREASDSALAYVTEHAGYTRVSDPDDPKRKPLVRLSGLSGVRYNHRTSRAGDPHLHTHTLVSNRQLRPDGQVGSIDGYSMYHEARAGGMIYQAQLRAALSRDLGVAWQAVEAETGMADIAGFDREAIEAWSQRHTQIDAWLDEHDAGDASHLRGRAGETATAQKSTRTGKDGLGKSTSELRAEWAADERAAMVNLDAVFNRDQALAIDDVKPSPEAVLLQVSQTQSTFTRADVVEAAAAMMPAGIDPETVLEDVENLADQACALCLDTSAPEAQFGPEDTARREGGRRFTTPDLVKEETRLLRTATSTANLGVDGSGIQPIPYALSEQQAQAMRTLVESDRRASVLIAPAGAGKTNSLRFAREAWENAGRTVVGLAPSGTAADQMRIDEATESAATVATVIGQLERGESLAWDSTTVVVVDEAGMAGTADLAKILDAAHEADARLILTGDPAQLSPVRARGGLLESLGKVAPDTAKLSEVFRQADPEEANAGLALNDGEGQRLADGIDWYSENGRLAAGSQAAMLTDAMNAYGEARSAGRDALLVVPTHEVADAMNAAIQREQRADLDPETAEQQPAAGLARGAAAYEGDLIMSTDNNYRLHTSAGEPVRNGHRWRVRGVDERGAIIAEQIGHGGRGPAPRVKLPASYLAESCSLGYAGTIHSAQGATCDDLIAVMDAERTERAAGYVAMTRGRHSNRAFIYTQEVGEADHEHAVSDAAKYRREDAGEAREQFAAIFERDTRDRSALTVIADEQRKSRLDDPQRRANFLAERAQLGEADQAAHTTDAEHADWQRRDTRDRSEREYEQRLSPVEQMRRHLNNNTGKEQAMSQPNTNSSNDVDEILEPVNRTIEANTARLTGEMMKGSGSAQQPPSLADRMQKAQEKNRETDKDAGLDL